jgi:hemerythrin
MTTPKDNGWRYFAINLTDSEHKELIDMMNQLCLMTGVHKKDIIKILVRDKLNKLKQKEK